jgi:hypothetical protein
MCESETAEEFGTDELGQLAGGARRRRSGGVPD